MNHNYINQFNLFDRYVLGKLAADEAEEFEKHFIDCPDCVEQLNISRSFIDDLRGLAVQETLFSSNRPVPAIQRWRLGQLVPLRWAAVTCCLVVVAGVFAFFTIRRLGQMGAEVRQAKEEASAISQKYQRGLETAAQSEKQHQETKQELARRLDELQQKLKTEEASSKRDQSSVRGSGAPEVNFPIYALIAAPRGQAPAPIEIAPPGSSSRFALSIPVQDSRDFSVYRVTIVNHQGVTVWKKGGFRPDAYHALSLSLNSNFLPPGIYDLTVDGLTPPNQWNTVGSYPFHLARRR